VSFFFCIENRIANSTIPPWESKLPLTRKSKLKKRQRADPRALPKQGGDPFQQLWVADIHASRERGTVMQNRCPAITRCRGAVGHFVIPLGRHLILPEMMRLQGMDPSTVKQVVSDSALGHQVGNAMSQNVLERIFGALLPAAGLAPHGFFVDRWVLRIHQSTSPFNCWFTFPKFDVLKSVYDLAYTRWRDVIQTISIWLFEFVVANEE
jgi:hypothetical protein